MICLDISQIVYKGTGVARFTDGLTVKILKEKENKLFSFFFSALRQKLPEELKNEIIRNNFKLYTYPIPPKIIDLIWNKLHRLSIDKLVKAEVFVSSDWAEPPKFKIKKATIVHDLAFLRYPETIHPTIFSAQKNRIHWVVKESDLIITDTQATKNDLLKLVPKNKELLKLSNEDLKRLSQIKIETIYPGVEINIPSKKTQEKALKKFKLKPKEYFLTVGKLEPRKNLKRLIQAFSKIKTEKKLVLVGPKGWENIEKKDKRIIITGYILDSELYSLYKNAYAFVYPSLWEGFGYPLIEAALLKTPIICSEIEIFKELIKESALYFNPKKESEIKKAIELSLNSPEKLKERTASAQKLAKRYNWNSYYQKFKDLLLNII